MWHKSYGVLKAFNKWVLVECGRELANYYCSLYNREFFYRPRLNPPLCGAHISVIRGEAILSTTIKSLCENMSIEFRYQTEMQSNGIHYWLPVICPLLDDVREAFGLGPTPVGYHLSIGNCVEEIRKAERNINASEIKSAN